MILELFIFFSVLSLLFIFLGYYTKPEIKVLAVLGFATLFFLGMLLQFSSVEVQNGETKSYQYVATTLNNETSVYNYSTIKDSTSLWIGRWLSIVSVLGMVLVFTSNSSGVK